MGGCKDGLRSRQTAKKKKKHQIFGGSLYRYIIIS